MRKFAFKHTICYVAVICMAVIASACQGGGHSAENDTVSFTDDYGTTSVIPAHPQHIVSASPAITEIIYALGGQDLLVGRTQFCAYPPQASKIPSIGGISNLNVEKILSLNPDLVISGSMIPPKSAQQLTQMGVPIVSIIEKSTFDGIYDNISRIGQIIGRSHEADSLNQLIRQQLSSIKAADTLSRRPTIYYVVGFGKSGNFTAGGNSFINDILHLSGARNIAEDLHGWEYSLESLISNDPDYILIRREDSASFCQMKPYSTLSAVRNHHVIAIESGMIDQQVPRNIDAIKYIFDALNK